MKVTASEARQRFGSICALAKREPVFVEKAGQVDSVILSLEHYRALEANQQAGRLSARKKAFESKFSEWITTQNAWIEAHGIPGKDLHPW